MHVIAYPKIRNFAEKYPDTKKALDRWFKTLSKNHYDNFDELRGSEKEYQRTLNLFEKLMDIVGDNKKHPLSSLMETLCLLIENYETKHYPKPEVSGNEILQFLMEQNALTPIDLPEIGNIDEVSKIINGQQELKTRQIRTLSERFHVSPEVFF